MKLKDIFSLLTPKQLIEIRLIKNKIIGSGKTIFQGTLGSDCNFFLLKELQEYNVIGLATVNDTQWIYIEEN